MVTGVWLTAATPRTDLDAFLDEMLAPRLPVASQRAAVLEELGRPAKRLAAILDALGLRPVAVDEGGPVPLRVVAPIAAREPWREALITPGGDCLLGLVVQTHDAGPQVLVHEVFLALSDEQQALVRGYAQRARAGEGHGAIVDGLAGPAGGRASLARRLEEARRQVLVLDPSLLFSPDGRIRVQLGSFSQTTRDILREGLHGEHLFVLPTTLFHDRTNHVDVEFLVYLNFFARERHRLRIVGTARQEAALRRLLTLTLFGVFDPDAPGAPGAGYGVPDAETATFLRTAFEMYAARDPHDPAQPILGVDRYIDFTLLEAAPAVVTIPATPPAAAAEVRLARTGDAVEVRIQLADGRTRDKRLVPAAPRRRARAVPEPHRRTLQFATDRPRFGVTPLGTSHGFDPTGDLTSFVVWVGGRGILVDPSPEALGYLEQMGVAEADVPFVFLTHIHADHDSGLFDKLLSGGRTTVIASDPVFRTFAEKARLVTGHDVEREGLVQHLAANPEQPLTIALGGETAVLETRWNLHPIPTNGLKVTVGGRTFGYSGDTQYDVALLDRLRGAGALSARHHDRLVHFFWSADGRPRVDLLYHEAGIPPIHTEKEALAALPGEVAERTRLVHVADGAVPEGFRPAKPELFATHVLLPPTAGSRAHALRAALRLVPYLYDLPEATLEAFQGRARLRRVGPGHLLIRQGPLPAEAPSFYVIADGEVAVRDGRRVLGRLGKGDTFGEWGIEHSPGLRTADVATVRECELLEFSDDDYRWLVAHHRVVLERTGTVRHLLPRLKLARARARRKSETGRPGPLGALDAMSESQLIAFVIFGQLRLVSRGMVVVAEGERVDGFYVVLAGTVHATVGGQPVSELGEGEVFGEIGLLEGGVRSATVTVASVDAELLFMSAAGFQTLMQSVPAFAWGIRETAERRRQGGRRTR